MDKTALFTHRLCIVGLSNNGLARITRTLPALWYHDGQGRNFNKLLATAILSPVDTLCLLTGLRLGANLTDKTGATSWEEVCYTIVGERKASNATEKEAV